MEHKRLAVFDLDGTLLDTLQDLTNAVNAALNRYGFPQRTSEEVRRFVGNGIRKLIERALPPDCPSEASESVYRACLEHYHAHATDLTRPYDGIPALLNQLKASGWRVAVVSNKTDDAVQALCNRYFEGLLDLCIGERPGIAKKPAPDSVLAILQQLNIDRADAVLIGDSEVDVETARHAAVDLIAVTWGFRSESLLRASGAVHIVSSVSELRQLLLPSATQS